MRRDCENRWLTLISGLALALAFLVLPSDLLAVTPVPLGRGASAAPELAISFEGSSVLASDLTPGGDALFFSLARIPLGYTQRVERRIDSLQVDSFGEASYDIEDGAAVPPKSVWVVVDLSSGAYAVAAPGDFYLEESPFPGNAFQVGAPGLLNRLRNTFPWVDMIVVRPGVGAWALRASDGGNRDRDGMPNGRTVTALEDAEPVGASPPPPDRYEVDDVVVVIDPRELRFYATRVLGSVGGEE